MLSKLIQPKPTTHKDLKLSSQSINESINLSTITSQAPTPTPSQQQQQQPQNISVLAEREARGASVVFQNWY